MRKILLLLVSFAMLTFGCSGLQIGFDDGDSLPTIAKITAREIGCEVARTGDADIDLALRAAYDMVVSGELNQETIDRITELLNERIPGRPTLIASVLDLIGLMGVEFNVRDPATASEPIEVTDISDIPPEVYEAVADGYVSGFNLCGGS